MGGINSPKSEVACKQHIITSINGPVGIKSTGAVTTLVECVVVHTKWWCETRKESRDNGARDRDGSKSTRCTRAGLETSPFTAMSVTSHPSCLRNVRCKVLHLVSTGTGFR